jgi:hypothetical protein
MSENGMDRKWSAYSHDGNDPNGRGAKVVGSPRNATGGTGGKKRHSLPLSRGVVKARVVKLNPQRGVAWAEDARLRERGGRSHLRNLERDGVTRDGSLIRARSRPHPGGCAPHLCRSRL